MTVTIRDVAKRLNLSTYTVSRALDGYDDVADATRQRVIEMAKEMGYKPSRAARQLRRKKADAIGYIIPASGSHFRDPFFSEFIAAMGDEVTSNQFELLVSIAPPNSQEEKHLYERWVQSHLVDGVLLSRMRLYDWRVEYLAQNQFPFVVHGHTLHQIDYPYIEMDSRSGFIKLVAHMVERGHKRIAFIGAPPAFTLQVDRFAGYQEGLAAANIPFDSALVIEGDLTRGGGYEAAMRLLALPQPPTAIIGANDLTAIGAMHAAHKCGLVVGHDLAIAGYDGIEDSEHTQPPLTTLKQPIYETVRRLVKMLIARITDTPLEDPHQIIQPELVIRESTGW